MTDNFINTMEGFESDAPLVAQAWKLARVEDGRSLNDALIEYTPAIKQALSEGGEAHVFCYPYKGVAYPRMAGIRFYVDDDQIEKMQFYFCMSKADEAEWQRAVAAAKFDKDTALISQSARFGWR